MDGAAVMDWSEKQIEQLRALWADGLTTSAIGRAMRISKNSVVGKAHRLDLPLRPSPIGIPHVDWTAEAISILETMFADGASDAMIGFKLGTSVLGIIQQRSKLGLRRIHHKPPAKVTLPPLKSLARKEPSIVVPITVKATKERVTPTTRAPRGTCQFPLTDGRPWLFCDKPTDGTWISYAVPSPYCRIHHAACYRRTEDRREAA